MKVNPGGFAPAPDTGGGDDIQDKAKGQKENGRRRRIWSTNRN
mgnify:CR=1 FL=1